MTKLPHDYCRCHDSKCPLKNSCERYLQRHTGEARTPHAASLRDGDKCDSYIMGGSAEEFAGRLGNIYRNPREWLATHNESFGTTPIRLFGTDREQELWDMLDGLESGEFTA